MNDRYAATRRCCHVAAMVQALILNVTPLFFMTLREQFSISFEKIGRLVLITFFIQLLVDFLAVYFADMFGPRLCVMLAEGCAAAGLILFAILPNVLPDAYVGMVLAVIVYSVGAGLAEVMISPIIDAIPSAQKASSLTMLHAYYPIGQVVAVLITTLAVALVGAQYWPWMLLVWSVVPLFNLVAAMRVPMPPMLKGDEKMPAHTLLRKPYFWLMMLLMVSGGSAEIAMSQWASLFAEEALGVPKLVGDLLGPCLFAVFMGIGRVWHGVWGERVSMLPLLLGSGIGTVVCYLVTVFSPLPILALLGCALCGLTVSLMWPGALGLAANHFPRGGTTLFALLALSGDIGCSFGPWITGLVADASPYGLKGGLLAAIAFPLIMVVVLIIVQHKKAVEE